MTAERSVIVICDRCEGICNVDHSHPTAVSARNEAKRFNWRRRWRGYTDICPYCVIEIYKELKENE